MDITHIFRMFTVVWEGRIKLVRGPHPARSLETPDLEHRLLIKNKTPRY
jgi:hypothetical protein